MKRRTGSEWLKRCKDDDDHENFKTKLNKYKRTNKQKINIKEEKVPTK